VKLFQEPQHLRGNLVEDPDVGLTEIDHEEQSAGYQAAYSRLAASESIQADPVAYVQNPQEFISQQLAKADPSVRSLLQMSDRMVVEPFLQSLGYV
jgi:exportin-2 (importin alpha re-exporter)